MTSPPPIALATTFDRRAALAPEALVEQALSLLQRGGVEEGRVALVIDAHLDPERLAALIPVCERRRELPVLAIEDGSGLAGHAALAALDKEEARTAIAAAEATLRRAAAVGARYVVLRLGWVEGARRDWIYARDRFLRGALGETRVRGLLGARDRVAPGHVDRARAALDRLCRLADSLGVQLLVKNGQRYVELPSPSELTLLRTELRGAPLAGLFDLPAAHLLDLMGFHSLALVEAAFGGGPIVYTGDACGAVAALPPGHGELGAAWIAGLRTRQKEAAQVFRPWHQLSDEEVALGLRGVG